jgi:hypothetical protein
VHCPYGCDALRAVSSPPKHARDLLVSDDAVQWQGPRAAGDAVCAALRGGHAARGRHAAGAGAAGPQGHTPAAVRGSRGPAALRRRRPVRVCMCARRGSGRCQWHRSRSWLPCFTIGRRCGGMPHLRVCVHATGVPGTCSASATSCSRPRRCSRAAWRAWTTCTRRCACARGCARPVLSKQHVHVCEGPGTRCATAMLGCSCCHAGVFLLPCSTCRC